MSLAVVLATQIMNTILISVPCVVGGQSPKLYRSTPGVVPHLTLQRLIVLSCLNIFFFFFSVCSKVIFLLKVCLSVVCDG